MTKDLALLISKDAPWLTTDEFMNALDENLARKLAPDPGSPKGPPAVAGGPRCRAHHGRVC